MTRTAPPRTHVGAASDVDVEHRRALLQRARDGVHLGEALAHLLGIRGAPDGVVGVGEVVTAAERVLVLGAEDPLEVVCERLEDRDRVLDATRVLVDEREVVARAQRVRVLAAERALAVGEQRLEDRDRVAGAPSVLVGVGEVVAGAQRRGVVGAVDRSEGGEQRLEA